MKRNSILFGALLVVLGSMFALGCRDYRDILPPGIASSDPVDGEVGVAVNKAVSITFSEEVDAASVSSETCYISDGISQVNSDIFFDGITVVISPKLQLNPNAQYYAGCTGEVKDLAGNRMGIDAIGSFVTSDDTVAPEVESVYPANNAVDIDDDVNIIANFNEVISTIVMEKWLCKLYAGSSEVLSQVEISGATITIIPDAPLAFGTTYNATCGAGVGDAYENMAESGYSWSFTTISPQSTPPLPPRPGCPGSPGPFGFLTGAVFFDCEIACQSQKV
jgi:hypothetical protein